MKKLFTLFFATIISFSFLNTANATTCAGAVAIPGSPAFPYVSSLTCGVTNDINSSNATVCGSGNYIGGYEAVYVWTPTSSYSDVSFAYSGQSWSGLFLYQGCPTSGGTCIGNFYGSASSKTLAYVGENMTSGTKIYLNSGVTYYLVIDTWPSPQSPCPGTITINGTIVAPCSGTPTPGNTVSTANPACPGVNFTLSLQNSTPGSGVIYQWQTSPNGTTWTNTGTSAPTFTTSQTTSTYYRCQVTCSGNTGNSNPLYLTLNPFYNCYCVSSANYTGDEDIFNVTVGSINNSSTCATLAPGPGSVQNMYSNYYSNIPPANLQRTTSQSFSVQVGTCGGNYSNGIKVFIDYNQNGNFADPGEEVYVSASSTSGPHTEAGSFVIPANATPGNTKFRVVNVETGTPSGITACGTYGWGETEDYAVNIADVPTVTTNAASGIGSTTATLNGTISANGLSTTVTFEWGTMTGPPFNNTITLPAPVTGQNIAMNTPISALQPNTTYYFRVIGTNSFGTINGTVLSFTTPMVAPGITTKDATTVGSSFATLNGTAIAYNSATTVSFEYGTTAGGPYPNVMPGIPAGVSGNNPTDFYAALTGLAINTTYYFRAKGTNGAGTTYGFEKNFYTTCVTPPTPGAISGPVNVCKNGTGYVYSVTEVPYGFYYNWIFPTGFTITSYAHSNSVSVNVSNTAISGTISVIAVSDCGAPSTASTKAVTVNNLPVPTVSGPSPVCQSTENLYYSQSGMTSYQWSTSPDGTITPTSNPEIVSINWSTAGAKTVDLIYSNPATGCTAAAPGTKAVTVTAAPVPTITGSSNMCVNSGYYDYSTETGMSNYSWNISPGGTITYGQNTSTIQVTWNVPGPQYVTVTYEDAGSCVASAPTVFNVVVDGLPGPAGTITGTSNVCYNSMSVPYSVAPISNTVYYVWTLPAGATISSGAGTNSITVDFTNSTDGDITVYGNSLCGNGATSPTFPVTITHQPGPAGIISGTTSVCEEQKGVAYSITPVPGATGYNWALPNGATIATGDNTPSITVDFAMGASSGVISVYGTNSCGYGEVSPDFTVTMEKKPDAPVITLNGFILTSNIPDGNQWYYNGAPITGATQQSLTALYDGWYWDVVTTGDCSSDSSNNIYVSVTGVGEPAGSKFLVYPIPNDGKFTLQIFTQKEETFRVNVYNSIGSSIYSKGDLTVKGQTDLTINLNPIPDGIYTIVLQNSEFRIIRKIIVNK